VSGAHWDIHPKLSEKLDGQRGHLAVIPANQISERMAGPAGWDQKSDILYARWIAENGIRFSDKLKGYSPKSHTFAMIQRLQRQLHDC